MIMQSLLTATVLAAAALAASAPGKRADNPETFRLWANMTYPDLPPGLGGPDVQGLELSYVPNDECQADVILVPAGQGSYFRTDGDTTGVDHFGDDDSPSAGLVARPGGTATVPAGYPIELQCSNGTSGIFLNDKGLDYPEETWTNGGWMACGSGFLSMFSGGQRPLSGCSVVQLLPIF